MPWTRQILVGEAFILSVSDLGSMKRRKAIIAIKVEKRCEVRLIGVP